MSDTGDTESAAPGTGPLMSPEERAERHRDARYEVVGDAPDWAMHVWDDITENDS